MQLEDMSRLVRACRRRAQQAIQEEAFWRQAISERTDAALNFVDGGDLGPAAPPALAARDVIRHDRSAAWHAGPLRHLGDAPARIVHLPR